jgi:uncharacterized GH25 family protein
MHHEFKESADLTKMVVGHELWLGQAKQEGDQREVSLLFGHNMRTDGVLNPARVKPLIYRPDGSTIQPAMSSESDRHRLRFPFAGDGCYTAIVDLVPIVVSQNSEGYHIGPKFQFKNDGWAKTPMTEDGDWMFLAKHRDPTKKVNEEFDMTNFVTTLVMEVQ